MGDIVNLNQFRKQKSRAAKQDLAAANREKFGRSKEQRALEDFEKAKADKDLNGTKIQDDATPPEE